MTEQETDPMLTVRPLEQRDLDATADLFHRAVHQGAAHHYTAEQRRAWAPQIPDSTAWATRLNGQTAFVAHADNALAGFMTLTADGVVDLAFVDPQWARRGIGGRLHDAILDAAQSRGLESLTTEASLVAKPFFEKHGWAVERRQTVRRAGVELVNFIMRRAVEM